MERTGESFKQVVNRLVRLGFGVPEPTVAGKVQTGQSSNG